GMLYRFGDTASTLKAHIQIHQDRVARRLLINGAVGLAEAYIDGDWSSPDLPAVIEMGARNEDYLLKKILSGRPFAQFKRWLVHFMHRNTRRGSKHNIASHYDLGNSFYYQWLDKSMTYSCALFKKPEEDLYIAQKQKYHAIAERAELKPQDRVLEIGCGWGGFAEYAAQEFGSHVTALTLSKAQYDYATERVYKAGLNERINVCLQDYRDVKQPFDKVVSIEMLEAVGEEYWLTYFNKIRDILVTGGKAAIQVITTADHRFVPHAKDIDFIQRYIFPGGKLPSAAILKRITEECGLVWQGAATYGQHYARTLALWRQRFLTAWPEISKIGFDDRFMRMWEYYLAYCEGGFRGGSINLHQISLIR
ncbi:MAG: cyclopropane-fatty-acyl-phospholipid synthase family protein, partial [Alphaproteobacteria bacterium]